MGPKLEAWILDQFNESDQQAPWMRSVDNQSLQQDSSDLFLNRLSIGLRKEIQESTREVVSECIWIPKLVGNGI